jgi:hypothetical protein
LLSFVFIIFLGNAALTIDEKVELSLLISPIFGVYVAAIVRKFVADITSPYDTVIVHVAFTILALGTAAIFGIAIPLTIFLFLTRDITTFAALKSYVGIIETALGVYTGGVIDALFAAQGRQGRTRRSGRLT